MVAHAPSFLVAAVSTTTGTGNLTLSLSGGGRTFADVFGTGSGNTFTYYIRHRTASEWERGTGYMSDATTLVRDVVHESSNSDAAVDFSAGTKEITNDILPSSGLSLPESIGTVSSGTIQPEPSDGEYKTLTNGGAFQWDAPAEKGGYIAYVLNNGSAGAITPNGFDYENSADFDTVDTNEFEVCVTNDGVRKIMTVRAL